MKYRILTGWNWRRILFLGMGTLIIIQSVLYHEWLSVLIGLYFASMGLFSFGCASGACYTGIPTNRVEQDENKSSAFNVTKKIN